MFQSHAGLLAARVSILTQPEGWVPFEAFEKLKARGMFQSSPNPKVGCHSLSVGFTRR